MYEKKNRLWKPPREISYKKSFVALLSSCILHTYYSMLLLYEINISSLLCYISCLKVRFHFTAFVFYVAVWVRLEYVYVHTEVKVSTRLNIVVNIITCLQLLFSNIFLFIYIYWWWFTAESAFAIFFNED